MTIRRALVRKSIPDAIADDLRDRILSGELREGEPIRQETLAAEYDVSRMPVREALKRLNAEGLIQWENNRGGTVTKHSLSEIAEIFDLRTLLEVELFREAIPKMVAADFERCEGLLSDLESSFEDGDIARWGDLNHRFHSALYSAANRHLTNDLLDRINMQADRYVRMHLSVMKHRAPAREDHRGLYLFARNGDIEKGCGLLKEHIQRTKAQLLDLIAAQRNAEE